MEHVRWVNKVLIHAELNPTSHGPDPTSRTNFSNQRQSHVFSNALIYLDPDGSLESFSVVEHVRWVSQVSIDAELNSTSNGPQLINRTNFSNKKKVTFISCGSTHRCGWLMREFLSCGTCPASQSRINRCRVKFYIEWTWVDQPDKFFR
jgi:hypothetical protein